jgi:hypothetical protein
MDPGIVAGVGAGAGSAAALLGIAVYFEKQLDTIKDDLRTASDDLRADLDRAIRTVKVLQADLDHAHTERALHLAARRADQQRVEQVIRAITTSLSWQLSLIDRLWDPTGDEATIKMKCIRAAKELGISIERRYFELLLFSPDKAIRADAARDLSGGIGTDETLGLMVLAMNTNPSEQSLIDAHQRLADRLHNDVPSHPSTRTDRGKPKL